jgi:methylated-DNA-[protein]-cysteine S-methyltransferase
MTSETNSSRFPTSDFGASDPDTSGANDLSDLFGLDDETVAADSRRLADRLVATAQDTGLLDVAYRTVESVLGELLLAATPAGLVRIAFTGIEDTDEVLTELAERVSPRVLRAPARLDGIAHQVDEYLVGARTGFQVALDFQLAHGFRRRVLDHLQEIPYGTTGSYGTVATAAGSPRAVRAVGTACALNPLPLVVPCHRVIRSDGSPGRYRGGEEAKLTLLELERSHKVGA